MALRPIALDNSLPGEQLGPGGKVVLAVSRHGKRSLRWLESEVAGEKCVGERVEVKCCGLIVISVVLGVSSNFGQEAHITDRHEDKLFALVK